MIGMEYTRCTKCHKEMLWEHLDEHEREKHMEKEFITKDSGERAQYSTGMVRDTNKGKPRYDLVWRPLLKRWAELMARGAEKYGPNNWQKAATQEELDRFKESANRHFEQWFQGDTDEDHGAAVIFNLAGAEYVKQRMEEDAGSSKDSLDSSDIPF